MSDYQLSVAARLWAQGHDTWSIAKIIWGTVVSCDADQRMQVTNREAMVYNRIAHIRQIAKGYNQ